MRPYLLVRLLAVAGVVAGIADSQPVVVTVLATTDLHGNLYPIDYGTDQPAPRGLAKIATLIRAAEAENPNHLLIDCGDTIQGSPLEFVYQTIVRTGKGPMGLKPPAGISHDPMMMAMNRLAYDSMTVGNHEYNFGLKNLDRARSEAQFPWISANTAVAPGGKERPYAPYIVKTVAGVKVAIVGITTPAVPTWEKAENLGAYRFLPPVEALRKAVVELRAKEHPDIILVAAHSGMGRNLATNTEESSKEDVVYSLATHVPEVDAIVFGHSHRELAARSIGQVLVIQPKNWGISLAKLDFTLERQPSGAWKLAGKQGTLIPVTAETPAAADILEIAKPYHELAEHHLDMPAASSPVALESALGRVEDTPVVDAVEEVELFYSKADVAFASVFNPSVHVPKGRVTVRQIAALYPYDNELYVIEGDGKMVKDALENSARYFLSCQGERCEQSPLTNPNVLGYNYDMAQGVEYEVDLTHPEGDRVRDLRWHGKPLAPDQKLRIAINNYRAAGSAGFDMFIGAKVVWRSQEEIRDMIVRYYSEGKPLPTRADGNWRIVPDAARKTLEKEARADAARQHLQ
ncbi:MAG TPA: 5'-nucleotidase C-terminal domain-containing protein [Bryobacteraceae bacterium]|nr:5'-nucleotidase C-terminal domain-containing protein [Bryobacteraceae bacterium]